MRAFERTRSQWSDGPIHAPSWWARAGGGPMIALLAGACVASVDDLDAPVPSEGPAQDGLPSAPDEVRLVTSPNEQTWNPVYEPEIPVPPEEPPDPPPPPLSFDLRDPLDGATNVPLRPTFTWFVPWGLEGVEYQIELRTGPSALLVVASTSQQLRSASSAHGEIPPTDRHDPGFCPRPQRVERRPGAVGSAENPSRWIFL